MSPMRLILVFEGGGSFFLKPSFLIYFIAICYILLFW